MADFFIKKNNLFAVLGLELTALDMLSKCFTAELHPPLPNIF